MFAKLLFQGHHCIAETFHCQIIKPLFEERIVVKIKEPNFKKESRKIRKKPECKTKHLDPSVYLPTAPDLVPICPIFDTFSNIL